MLLSILYLCKYILLEPGVSSNNYKAWQADGYHGGRDLDRTEGKLPYCATT